MQGQRLPRVNEVLKREIATALFRLGTEDGGLDVARVSITRVEVSRNLRHARVEVSVLGGADRAASSLSALNRRRAWIQEAVHRHVKLKYTPVLHFHLDPSVAEGDRLLRLIDELGPSPEESRDAEDPEGG
jgi:ribosome-binding factor A